MGDLRGTSEEWFWRWPAMEVDEHVAVPVVVLGVVQLALVDYHQCKTGWLCVLEHWAGGVKVDGILLELHCAGDGVTRVRRGTCCEERREREVSDPLTYLLFHFISLEGGPRVIR